MALLNKLFLKNDSSEGKAIDSLMGEEDSKRLILKQAAIEILESGEVFIKYPNEQIIALAMTAIKCGENGFADDEEACQVGAILCRHIKTKKILPMVTDYYRDNYDFFDCSKSHIELGEKCLVALSLFRDRMVYLSKRHSFPSPSFYEGVGKREFAKEGLNEIADHFSLWTDMFDTHLRAVREKYQWAAEEKYLLTLINPMK